ncbi:MAG: 4'-phosphopantetheinyl transferase superfamily protein [Cytophagales bacterium]
MPFIKFETLNETSQWGLWFVNETVEELFENLTLSPFDKEEYKSISHPTRQLEWLAARKAMQELVTNSRYQYHGIQKEANGKSHLFNHQLHISISHTKDYAAVMLGSLKEVGIDIELLKTKITRISHKFVSKYEFHLHTDDTLKLTIAWCAKEAIYKYLGREGISFQQHIFLEDFSVRESGTITAFVRHPDIQESVTLCYLANSEFCIAYTL